MTPDIINGIFETLASLFIVTSIIRLHKDKKVRGVTIKQVLFFTLWGYWNVFYYPHLNQYISFGGGVLVVITNTIWTSQMIYYSLLEKDLDLLKGE